MQDFVLFKRGSSAQYRKLKKKDPNTLYFVFDEGADTGDLYLGSTLVAGDALAKHQKLEDLANLGITDELLDGAFLYWNEEQGKWLAGTLPQIMGISDEDGIITKLTINGERIKSTNGAVEIPVATADKLGVVKGGSEIGVAEDGAMSINSLSIGKLTQSADEELILQSYI